MITSDQIDTLNGADVIDNDGDKVGTVGQVYLSSDGGEPLFVTVKTGLFGLKESFVPLEGASASQDGVRVAYDKAVIKDAPRIDADQEISEDEQSTLFDYYDGRAGGTRVGDDTTDRTTTTGADTTYSDATGRSDLDTATGDRGTAADYSGTDADYTGANRTDGDRTDVDGGYAGAGVGAAGAGALGRDRSEGHDTSGPNTDDAMTLSEERLKTGVQRVETGRARLRKHIVTEQQTVTVPTTHDEVRVEREPINDANAGAAYDGPDLSEEEHEVVLTEERPVVEKETVPVERVRLSTETVADQQQVTQDVRHEEVDTDGVDGASRDRGVDRDR